MMEIINHPEYNSTLILRSEILEDDEERHLDNESGSLGRIKGMKATRNIRRKLVARRPGRDASLDQDCTFLVEDSSQSQDHEVDLEPCVVVLTPILEADQKLPHYHPKVAHIAFRYLSLVSAPSTIRIEVFPLPSEPISIPVEPGSRLYRTCLALLDTLHRYGWSQISHYQKRVLHDCIIPRNTYQDHYLVMRECHGHLVETWQENTDPLKHVYEDISIATYLMLLWKYTFPEMKRADDEDFERSWDTWGRPPGGFLDFGCGNGLLTHILVSEGYTGKGVDVRRRVSWDSFPSATQESLHVHAVDPTNLDASTTFLPPGVFIIANHADELSPWTPVISTVKAASGYLSIPCCAWAFDTRYSRERHSETTLPPEEINKMNLGGEGQTSSYAKYRIWLAAQSVACGWDLECDTLRIPSTRNWAIIGALTISLWYKCELLIRKV
ncbi:DUF1613-domain-containing protein [Sistotremastrum suecicum HHB10207 ss-3]|uniref:tRNA (uracil-O(2)-)-methyltransferase n=1 Tax=Sistotremastrum suecicum HHB10207 ss-3 TaxID=1314776 RepID=A0A166A8M4_9AGAM|nr:DUF1613-domain-containing protein [Sistotremastrum suecicum HHB10207 ss-3]